MAGYEPAQAHNPVYGGAETRYIPNRTVVKILVRWSPASEAWAFELLASGQVLYMGHAGPDRVPYATPGEAKEAGKQKAIELGYRVATGR